MGDRRDISVAVKRSSQDISCFIRCAMMSLLLGACTQARAAGSLPDTLETQGHSRSWTLSLSGVYYMLPEEDDIPVVTAMGDRDHFHLEARYNYEGRRRGSAFLGWNISGGESFQYALTPMAGMVFGSTTGLIPALRLSLGYGIADFYAETEYVYDLHETEGNFFYSWLELGFTPADMIRAGGVAQRTRIIRTPLDVDRGVFAQLVRDPGSLSFYAFNIFTESWFLVFGVSITL